MIAIVLLISPKPACHTLKTYAYPVIEQGRKRVGIACNLPASLFFGLLQAGDTKCLRQGKSINSRLPFPPLPNLELLPLIKIASYSKFKESLRNN